MCSAEFANFQFCFRQQEVEPASHAVSVRYRSTPPPYADIILEPALVVLVQWSCTHHTGKE